MREVESSDAKARLPQLLNEVEHGASFIITRHGRAIARLLPETMPHIDDVRRVMAEITAFRASMPSIAVADILAARHEGRRC